MSLQFTLYAQTGSSGGFLFDDFVTATDLPWCEVAQLADDFDDGELAPIWSPRTDSLNRGSVVEHDGAVVLSLDDQNSSHAGLLSATPHDFTDGSATLEVSNLAAEPAMEFTFEVGQFPGDGEASFAFDQHGTLTLRAQDSTGSEVFVTPVPYDADQHRYLRISHDGESGVVWEMSPDGSSWGTAYHKADVGFPLDAVRVVMRAEAFGGVTTAIRLESFHR